MVSGIVVEDYFDQLVSGPRVGSRLGAPASMGCRVWTRVSVSEDDSMMSEMSEVHCTSCLRRLPSVRFTGLG